MLSMIYFEFDNFILKMFYFVRYQVRKVKYFLKGKYFKILSGF